MCVRSSCVPDAASIDSVFRLKDGTVLRICARSCTQREQAARGTGRTNLATSRPVSPLEPQDRRPGRPGNPRGRSRGDAPSPDRSPGSAGRRISRRTLGSVAMFVTFTLPVLRSAWTDEYHSCPYLEAENDRFLEPRDPLSSSESEPNVFVRPKPRQARPRPLFRTCSNSRVTSR